MPPKPFARSAALVLFLLLLTIWSANCRSPDGETAAELEIGAIFPLTGDIASYGIAAKQGIELAVQEINDQGGIGGRQLTILYEDSQGQAANAVAAMRKLISVDKVPLVMGAAASSVTLALCPIANREKVVLITPISSSPELTQQGGAFFFRVCPSDVVQAAMMAQWIKEENHSRVGVIFVNNSWGDGLKNEFLLRFSSLGGEIAAVEAVNEGERNLRAQLTRIIVAKPDALYGITYGREGGALLRQAKELGFTEPIYGADVWGSPELLETAQETANGVKIIVPTQFGGTEYEQFSLHFQETYGSPPDIYAAYAYDMTKIVASALATSPRGEALREALAQLSYTGVTGLTQFDANGDVVGKGFSRKVLP